MRKFLFNDESGATLVEYGVALIVAIVVGGVALNTLATGSAFNVDSACDSLSVTGNAATFSGCT